jgi:S1-C subfamily serine protease
MRSFPMSDAARQSLRCASLLLAMLLVLPVTAGAQEPLGRPLADRVREARVLLQAAARAELGVVLGDAEQVDGRNGVRVLQAIPDRPAARAGIRGGDILLSLNGTALGDEPGRDVTRLMADVEPGDMVVVVVHRDGSDRTVRVVTEARRAPQLPAGVRVVPHVLRPGTDRAELMEALSELRLLPAQLGRDRLELVAMNPGLGRYFGVDEGVLVANVAADSRLGLQAGDVILAIGGRTPRDAAHARSILASYRADEEVEIQVMRDRRRTAVRGTRGQPR